MNTQKAQYKRTGLDIRVVSPTIFPFDPRYEQMRTTNVLPAGRVFGGHKRDQSRLLSLPDEILWQITELLAKPERGRFLSQFALVHRECRQLARPHQFADIFITRTEKSWRFLLHLLREANHDEFEPAGWSPGLSIGACIRSLSITIDEELCVDYGCSTDEDYEEWCNYWQVLMDDLAGAVEFAMPNLERVYWMDTADLEVQPHFLRALLQHSSSSSGRLHEIYFADYKFLFEELDHVMTVIPPRPMRLRSFALGNNEHVGGCSDPDGCVPYLAENILRRCAPTLESFVWNAGFEGEMGDDYPNTTLAFRDGPIEFPRLRKFWAGATIDVGIQPSVLQSILAAPLESFSPSAILSSMIINNKFVDKFLLPRLRTFAIHAVDLSWDETTEYVDQVFSLASFYARQIEELFIYTQGNVDQLVSHLSNNNFCKLRSLCFSWTCDPELRVLKAIGSSLVTLKELSFGFQPHHEISGCVDDSWGNHRNHDSRSPSHDDIITAISPLKKLVRLAVFGDEYIADWCGSDWAWHHFFKEHVWYNQGRSFCTREQGCTWAEGMFGHNRSGDKERDWTTPWVTGTDENPRSVMVEVAGKYAVAFPSLRELICGRALLEITGRGQI